MAKARRIKERVIRPEKVDRIQLTLTEGEADFLQAVLSHVGDWPIKSPAKYAPRIRSALIGATGQHFWETDAYPLSYVANGGIHFNEYPTKAERSDAALRALRDKLTYDGQ